MSVSFPVQVSDFPPGSAWAHLNGSQPQTFSWSSILRAAMVAGYPDLESIPSPQFARWRTAALHMALRHYGGQLIQPPEWQQLDQSEKAAVSSLLGVVVTKLLVERLLGAPILLFLDVHCLLTFPPDAEHIRPDFVAMTPDGGWYSVEAKGRSRFRQATLDKGKRQASALGTVNGEAVRAGVVCVTSFRDGRLEARFADPPPASGASPDARIDPMEALRIYYGQLDRFRKYSEPVRETVVANTPRDVKLSHSPDLDVDFGIIPELETALQAREPERAFSILKDLSQSRVSQPNPNLGADGIVVIPGESWQPERAQ